MQEPHHFSLPFLHKQHIAKETVTFSFDTRSLLDFAFLPGQFIRMTLDLQEKDPRSNRRYFTISSSPLETNTLSITTKIISTPSIFKQKLASLHNGEEVSFWGPSGSFILPEEESIPLVFLSGGIGITPFHSMLTYLAKTNSSRLVTLLASFSTDEEMVFYDELRAIGKSHPNVKIIYSLTHPTTSWIGETGRITQKMLQQYVSDLPTSLVYVSGPDPFVKAMVATVQTMGIPKEHIKQDTFPGY